MVIPIVIPIPIQPGICTPLKMPELPETLTTTELRHQYHSTRQHHETRLLTAHLYMCISQETRYVTKAVYQDTQLLNGNLICCYPKPSQPIWKVCVRASIVISDLINNLPIGKQAFLMDQTIAIPTLHLLEVFSCPYNKLRKPIQPVTYVVKKDITAYTPVYLPRKTSNILQHAFETMRVLAEGWKITLSGITPQVDSCMIQLFGCALVKDITTIYISWVRYPKEFTL